MRKTIDEIIDGLIKELKENEKMAPKVFEKNNDYASCNYVSRSTGVVSGTKVSQLVYRKLSNKITFEMLKKDGEFINRGDVIAVISGPVDEILKAEHLALSFIRYMSGIASLTRKYLMELNGTPAEIEYSDYSAPGLDELAKRAFVDGGGILEDPNRKQYVLTRNIRARFDSYEDAIKKIKEVDKTFKPIIEVSNLEELNEALETNGATIRICSNKYEFLLNAASLIDKRKNIEAFGDIDLKKIRSLALKGYAKFLIPSLTDAAMAFPIDMCFYKRPKIKK